MDEQVARFDAQLADRMSQFVCVRLIQANGLDLGLFQFDFDLTFAVLFLNADRTIYGRFGTRTRREADEDITVEGLGRAMAAALELHRGYPGNRALLSGKQGGPVSVSVPEEFPMMKGKFAGRLDFEGAPAQSCIHCHMVREAERREHRDRKEAMPESLLYPWPDPRVVGLGFDPRAVATLRDVSPNSVAAAAGLRAGDMVLEMEGQPLVSVADVQWVLHRAGDRSVLRGVARRDGRPIDFALNLESGWRRRGSIAWRPTSWDLRRMATGGLVLEDLSNDARRSGGYDLESMALKVTYVGQYGEHAAGKQAGVEAGDIIVAWDGMTGRASESDLLARGVENRAPGEKVSLTVRRGERRITMEIPVR